MACGFDSEKLSAYLDNELSGNGRMDVERHLSACSECSALLGEFRENDSGVRNVLTPSSTRTLETMEARVLGKIKRSRGVSPLWLGLAAASILATLFILYLTPPPEKIQKAVIPRPAPIVEATVAAAPESDELADVFTMGGTLMLNALNVEDNADIAILQSATFSNGVVSRLNNLRVAYDTDETTKQRIASLETVIIGLNNAEPDDPPDQVEAIKGIILDNDFMKECKRHE